MTNEFSFKNLATVDTASSLSETANVLVEEGGEIKRVPKSELGGTATDTTANDYDAVINYDYDDSNFTFISGGFEAIKNKLDNNIMPNVIVLCNMIAVAITAYINPDNTQIVLTFIVESNIVNIGVKNDNTIEMQS